MIRDGQDERAPEFALRLWRETELRAIDALCREARDAESKFLRAMRARNRAICAAHQGGLRPRDMIPALAGYLQPARFYQILKEGGKKGDGPP